MHTGYPRRSHNVRAKHRGKGLLCKVISYRPDASPLRFWYIYHFCIFGGCYGLCDRDRLNLGHQSFEGSFTIAHPFPGVVPEGFVVEEGDAGVAAIARQFDLLFDLGDGDLSALETREDADACGDMGLGREEFGGKEFFVKTTQAIFIDLNKQFFRNAKPFPGFPILQELIVGKTVGIWGKGNDRLRF
jgi:hypothetical protein